jgi:hypothetical protein
MPRYSHRRHRGGGMRKVRSHIMHTASNKHALELGQTLSRGARAAADDIELSGRNCAPDHRQDFGREPCHRVNIRGIVHRAGEDVGRQFRVEDRGMCRCWIKVSVIDAAADSADSGGAIRDQASKQRCLCLRNEAAHIELIGDPPLQRADLSPLPPVDQTHRPSRGIGIGTPLLRIHVRQIANPPLAFRQIKHVRCHVARIDEDYGRPNCFDHIAHPAHQSSIMKEARTKRFPGQEPVQAR